MRTPKRLPGLARLLTRSVPAGAALALLAAGAARPAYPFTDTHLDEISEPLLTYAATRVAGIDGLPSPTKAERAERKRLAALVKQLSREARDLGDDFAELSAGAKTLVALGAAAAPGQASADLAFARADVALEERSELLLDHRVLLLDEKRIAKLDASLAKADDLRTRAAAETRADRRAKLLVQAEAVLTAALRTAEKDVQKIGRNPPPARLRSGDEVGPAGGRVAIPRNDPSELAGASVLFPPGALGTIRRVTIQGGPDFVPAGGAPAGPALYVSPEGVVLNQQVTVSLPYALPAGRTADELDVYLRTPDATAPLGTATLAASGALSATTTTLGSFQAAVVDPPAGVPRDTYAVQMLVVLTTPGTSSQVFQPGTSAATFFQSLTFRRSGTGRASVGTSQALQRAYLTAAPRHDDAAGAGLTGSYDFAWTSEDTGRFAFSFPLGATEVNVKGTVSADNEVISFSGHGAGADVFGVGLRSRTGADTSQLSGRWVVSETGVQFADDDVEPFRLVTESRSRICTIAGGGGVTFDAAGSVNATTVTYATQATDPVHALSATSGADGGAETWTVAADGTLSDAAGKRSGLFDPTRGIFVTRWFDAGDRSLRIAVGVRQAVSPAGDPTGAPFDVVSLALGQRAGIPDARTSELVTLATRGTLSVSGGTVGETTEEAERITHGLTGPKNAGAVTWTLAQTFDTVPAATGSYPWSPDTSGTFLSADGNVLWALSSDGAFVLGTRLDQPSDRARGILLGLR